jgi:predicted 3-demethylubiquinone-9 3-methyltransferase (glyoxalase superfamily)
MSTIAPCLWFFQGDAEEALTRYVALFSAYGPASVVQSSRAGEGVPGIEPGSMLTMTVDLGGRELMAINGGPADFAHSPAFSLFVSCASQEEVDHYWDGLLADGGQESQCGWLIDRWGVSWQIVPTRLGELLGGDDAEGSQRALQAMLAMRRIDVAELERAYAGE